MKHLSKKNLYFYRCKTQKKQAKLKHTDSLLFLVQENDNEKENENGNQKAAWKVT